MGIVQVRNMYASVWLSRLLDAGVVRWADEGYLSLTADWLAAWDRRRVEDEEEMDRERDRERHKRTSAAWALRVAEHADGLHQRRLDREALACFDGEIPPEADGFIEELEPVEEGAHGPEDASVGVEVQEPSFAGMPVRRRQPVESSRRSGDHPSGLARALSSWLERSPGDHPDRHPPGERRMQTSWLGSTVWSYEPGMKMPDVSEVAAALSELDGIGAKEAA
jgi:hypothetical protein